MELTDWIPSLRGDDKHFAASCEELDRIQLKN